MKKLAAFIYLIYQVGIAAAQTDSGILVFRHANVIDGLSNKPQQNVTLTGTNGKITSIKKDGKAVPPNAVFIDLKGKWVMPGYIDAHVHFGNTKAAQIALSWAPPRLGPCTAIISWTFK